MSLFTSVSGSPETWFKNLADTTEQTICSASQNQMFRLESIVVACTTGGSTFSLWVDDGTNDVHILNAKAISANDYLHLEHPVIIQPNSALKCKDHTGAKLSVTATVSKLARA